MFGVLFLNLFILDLLRLKFKEGVIVKSCLFLKVYGEFNLPAVKVKLLNVYVSI